MTKHLGGPETEEQIISRHRKYLNLGDTGAMYRVLIGKETVGSIGYWERLWNRRMIYEMGWSILPYFQGKGFATLAVYEAVKKARLENKHAFIHAFPSIHNPASNAICRKLNFKLEGPCKFEYPIGHLMHCNDWKLQLLHA
jgi:RimJ/RimL family protein N-acetyltransferase